MKIKGLDGKIYSWNLTNYTPLNSDDRERSGLHKQAREVIKLAYPCCRILEEVPLPGSEGLYADFYIPMVKTMVEANGNQHYEYVPYFHGTPMGFIESKKRDANKKRWCEINGITLIVLPYNKTKEWEHLTDGRFIE